VKVYIKPSCPWCIDALRYLDEKGFQYEKIDVLKSRAAYDEMIALSGQSLTPTMQVDGKVLADFGVDELVPFLAKHGIQP
jgi:glutaredoxin 3